jgi:putative flippase GtrA
MNHARKEDRRRVLLRTYACYGFTGIILNNILSTLWIKGLGISKYISPLLNLFITIPVNYLTNKYWAYAKKDDSDNE